MPFPCERNCLLRPSQISLSRKDQSNYVDSASWVAFYKTVLLWCVILYFVFTQGKDQVLSQLGSNEAVLFRGIADAFPNAVIPPQGKGIYQKTTKPYPSCALIGVQSGYTRDDRIVVTTLLGEEVDLNNRSRAYKPSGIETLPLPVHRRSSIDDVGNVMLVAFGSKTPQGTYQAVCEDILLWSNSGQTEQVQCGKHVNM